MNKNTATNYTNISAEEAKEYIDNNSGFIILDVRSQEEYNEGHIPNAINIPDYEIEERANSELKDKNQVILVYCRSGYRSELSAKKLSQMGYIKIYNFGGIIDWLYDIESFQ